MGCNYVLFRWYFIITYNKSIVYGKTFTQLTAKKDEIFHIYYATPVNDGVCFKGTNNYN